MGARPSSQALRDMVCLCAATMSIAALGGAPPAAAQHMNAADAPCRDTVQTAALTTCLASAAKRADQELNQVYRQLLATSRPARRVRLEKAERAWIVYRDAFCEAEYRSFDGGSGGPPARLGCIEALSRHQTTELRTSFR